MNIMIRNIAAVLMASLTIAGCEERSSEIDIDFADFAGIALESIKTGTEPEITHQDEFEAMSAVMGIAPGDDAVKEWLETPAVRFFAQDVDSLMQHDYDLQQQISHIVSEMAETGLDMPVRSFASVIWGRPRSIVFADSVMLIALNHYLGSEHPAYSSLPAYRRQAKNMKMLPYDIAESMVATAYPYEQTDSSSVINRLVYEGALAEAKMKLVKNSSLNEALGYNNDELQWLADNEREIWRKMLSSHMIFDRSETMADRLVSPSPFTTVISPDAPGRAGRYIGYKIVKSYLDSHSDAQLSDVLSPKFYNRANPLIDAQYNP